jgi:hypothetical protein
MNVYMLRNTDSLSIIVLCVDDSLIKGSLVSTIVVVKTTFHDRCPMTKMGLLHCFLGLEFSQNDFSIKIS